MQIFSCQSGQRKIFSLLIIFIFFLLNLSNKRVFLSRPKREMRKKNANPRVTLTANEHQSSKLSDHRTMPSLARNAACKSTDQSILAHLFSRNIRNCQFDLCFTVINNNIKLLLLEFIFFVHKYANDVTRFEKAGSFLEFHNEFSNG